MVQMWALFLHQLSIGDYLIIALLSIVLLDIYAYLQQINKLITHLQQTYNKPVTI